MAAKRKSEMKNIAPAGISNPGDDLKQALKPSPFKVFARQTW